MTIGLNAGILFTDYQIAQELLEKRTVYIEIVHADGVTGESQREETGSQVKQTSRESIEESPKGKEQSSTLGEAGNIEEMIRNTFPENPEIAVAVFRGESGLNPSAKSITDFTADGRPFSVGLAQINLTQHKIGNLECYKAFKGRNSHAIVINESLYQECVKAAQNADMSLKEARRIYEARGFEAWGAFLNKSYLQNL